MRPRFFPLLLIVAAACATQAAPPSAPLRPVIVPTPPPPRPVQVDEAWVDQTIRSLSLREKVGQLVVPRISGGYLAVGTPEYERLRDWIVNYGVGGVIVTIGPPLELASKLNIIQSLARVPLLVTADMEHGPGQTLQTGTILPYGIENGTATRFPPLMGLGATRDEKLAYELGRITAIEGRAAGVHMTFAPVVDVNNNPGNPIINTRSYSEDPQLVARLAVAHIKGIQDHGMLATAKHFPGHGDTGTDSHINLPFITVNKARADSIELPPYRRAIETGVAAVMTAHIAFPALTGDSVPATLNRKVLTGLLRDELKFQGLIVTDAMDMGAIIKNYGNTRAPIMALQAGADALLQPLPQDVPAIVNGLVAAVESGELSEARIDQSLRKLLVAKTRLGLHQNRYVDLAAIPTQLATPRHLAIADSAAERAITAVRDQRGLLPVRASRVLSIVYADDPDPFTGRTFQRAIASAFPDSRRQTIDARTTRAALDSLLATVGADETVLFSPFINVSAYKGGLAVPQQIADFVRAANSKARLVVTSFGNPYLLQQFPEIGSYVVAWGQWDVLQRAAARALTGQAPITGRLPIAIPPLHKVGDGLNIR